MRTCDLFQCAHKTFSYLTHEDMFVPQQSYKLTSACPLTQALSPSAGTMQCIPLHVIVDPPTPYEFLASIPSPPNLIFHPLILDPKPPVCLHALA